MHVLMNCDTTQATSGNRGAIYVNGVKVTAFDLETYPSQNFDTDFNSTSAHDLGRQSSGGYYCDFMLADVYWIDGQALTPSSFTETDASTGQLIPKAFAGSYGTNGFHLEFADNSNNTATTLGKDTSGAGNNWDCFNLQTTTGGPTSVAAASGALPIYNTTDTYGATKGTGTRTDGNSSSIVLAVPMDGANNGTTFTDESATIKGSGSAKTLTRNGDTKTVTAESKFYGSSGYFDGTGDYLSASSADFAFGTGDFTDECWVRVSAIAEQNFVTTRGSAGNANAWSLAINASGNLYVYTNAFIATGTIPLKANSWSHVAACRSGSTLRLFIDGIQVASATNSQDFTVQDLAVGHSVGGTQFPLTGHMQDVRLYKGVAKYTSNFKPPSSTQNATVAAGNDSLVDTPTSYGTDTGAGSEVRGNYCTWNPLSNNTTLSNGNLQSTQPAAQTGVLRPSRRHQL